MSTGFEKEDKCLKVDLKASPSHVRVIFDDKPRKALLSLLICTEIYEKWIHMDM